MKKFIMAFTVACSILCGCSEFLNVDNIGKDTIEGFFSDVDGLKAAGIGLHRCILEFYDDEYLRFGDKTNAVIVNISEGLKYVFDFNNQAEHIAGFPYYVFNKGYAICTNANNILFYGEKLLKEYPKMEDTILENFGYAYFARALAIFELCNVYAMPYDYTPDASHLGVVPIDYVPGFDDILQRESVKVCYDMVLSDLNTAIGLLEGRDEGNAPYYISADACKALLARVYLYMKDYAKVIEYCEPLMKKYPLDPRDKYVTMFRKAQDYKGTESIFRLNSYNAGTGMRSVFNPLAYQDVIPCEEFIASFSDNDVRKELFTFIGEPEDNEYEGQKFTTCCKYLALKNGVSAEENRRCDPFVLRGSDIVLMHAEASCALGKLDAAVDDVKTIQARALGVDKSSIVLSYTGANGLDKLIQDERAKELCYEGHRFFDLKRRGEDIIRPASTNSQMKHLTYPDYRYALPISQTELQANDYMIQNEGYNGRKSLEENN